MIKRLLFALLISTATLSAQTQYKISPTVVDANVVKDTSDNYVYINNGVTPLNKLFLFLPGSGGLPSDYTNMLSTAANLGYHAIGLEYDNDSTIASDCSGQPNSCPGDARAEVFYGKNYSTVVAVDTEESIRTRVVDLLKYLQKQHPSDNWGQYLDSKDSIIWSSVCISGHSQGAGMASLIAYWYNVYRGVFFSTGGDWSASSFSVATWMEKASVTPASRKYAFTHREDELFWGKLKEAPTIWDTLGIGTYINVDTITTNYYDGHSFTSYDTLGIPAGLLRYHDCTGANYYTPTVSGKLLYQPLWQYLLGDTAAPASVNNIALEAIASVYPNPVTSNVIVNVSVPLTDPLLSVTDITGRILLSEKQKGTHFTVDLSSLQQGIYFIKLSAGNTETVKKVVKL